MIKKLFRTWLPVFAAFALGWAAQVYWLGGTRPVKAAPRPHVTVVQSNQKTGSAFSANHANAVKGKDTEPQLEAWSLDSALGKILATTSGGQRELAIAGLVNQTPEGQLGKLIDEARFCPDNDARTELLNLAYSKWAVLDPASALAFARTAATKRYDKDSGPLAEVLATWAGHDPQDALAAAEALDLGTFQMDGIRAVLQAWGETSDPQGAVDAAKKLGLGTQLNSALSAIYEGWAERDPAGAFAALGAVDNLNTRNNLASTILTTMADQDPKGALALFQTLSPGAQNSSQALNYIFSRLTLQNPHAAVDALGSIPMGNLHERAITCIACDWADSDPQGAVSWASSLANPADRDTALYNAVRHVSTTDPAAAAGDLKLIPDMNQRNQAMSEIVGRWTDQDPTAALKWVQTNTTGTTQTMALGQVINSIAQYDPLSALGVLQQMPDSSNYNNMVFLTINSWSQSDPNAALTWAQNNLSGAELATASSVAVRQLINVDPAAGAQYVTSMPDGANRNGLISQVASSMAREDAGAALNWLNSVDASPGTRDNAINQVMQQLTSVDPQLAEQTLLSANFDLSTSTGQNAYNSAASQIASGLALTDPNAALTWAESQTGAARQTALGAAINSIANNDPDTAWAAVENMPADDPARSMMATNVIYAYAREDPATAVSLLGDLNPGQMTNAIGQISNNWLRQDPYQASQWIATLPTGDAKDTAVQNLLNIQGQYDLNTSLQWVNTLSTDAAKMRGYTTILQQTARTNPAEAETILGGTNLTDAQRTQLTQVIQRTQASNAGSTDNINYGYGPGNPPPGFHYEYTNDGQQRLIRD